MANKTFVAKNGLTANTANVFMSDLSTGLTTATILIKDTNHKLGSRTPAQINRIKRKRNKNKQGR